MVANKQLLAVAALAGLALANPAPQQIDFAQIDAAPTVASGPPTIPTATDGEQTATLYSSFTVSGAQTAAATEAPSAINKRTDGTSVYTPYYPALATSYTTDPALSATKTTTAGQACVTQPEAGTYCGFINPLDACSPQPDGYGPVPKPDTDEAFLKFDKLHSLAQAAPAKVPSSSAGTSYKQVFKDLDASVSSPSYLTLITLKTYDVSQCAKECDSNALCTSFNIFAERDPSLNPSTNVTDYPTVWGYNCPNPPSMTSFKCTLFGSSITKDDATNKGQYREQFHVVITGSDGYDRTADAVPPPCQAPSPAPVPAPVPPPGTKPSPAPKPAPTPAPKPSPWKDPHNCKGKGIDAPRYCMGSRFFPGPFNPQVCSDFAFAQNEANRKAGKTKASEQCSMFNAQYLHKNGRPLGTYCNLFNTVIGDRYATFTGTSHGSDRFDCKQSWTYSLK